MTVTRSILIIFCIPLIFHSSAFAKTFEVENLCTNGGLEELDPQGFPIGWGGFAAAGASFGVSRDAYDGNHALLLKSTSDAVVGINRADGALIPLTRGVAAFWYKAVSSEVDGRNLQVCIIAMDESGQREIQRDIFIVPSEHVGDRVWHVVEMEFDFRSYEDARLIHFAPRINETSSKRAAGEFLLDNVQVTILGPRLALETFGVTKPLIRVGETAWVQLVAKNVGDRDVVNADVTLLLPSGVIMDAGSILTSHIAELSPDQSTLLDWQIRGEIPGSHTIEVAIDSSVSSGVHLTVADLAEPELLLSNEHISLAFYRTDDGYGIFAFDQFDTSGPFPLAQSSMFSLLIYRAADGTIKHMPLFADEIVQQNGEYIFRKQLRDDDGVLWNFQFVFGLSPGQKWINVTYRASAQERREVLAFYGPVLYTSRYNRYDAVFPGLEFLEGEESSSSTLDIAPPHHIRRVPHPNKVTVPLMAVSENVENGTVITGMMWNARKKWAKDFDRPSVLFASPNRFESMEDYDVMGLFAPSVPNWVEENHTYARIPYDLQPEDTIEIEAQLFSIHKPQPDVSAVYAIPYWIEKYGLPDPLPLPRSTPEKEIEFSLTAYMDTLWMAEENIWHNTLDYDPWEPSLNPDFVRQLWFGAAVLPDAPRRNEYIERARFAFDEMGHNLGKDLPFYMGNLDEIYPGVGGGINSLILAQEEDGSWGFDPDWWNANDKIHHQDYHKLGEEGDVEVGTCAENAYQLLRYARMTGDKVSLEFGLKALNFMNRFKIPRAAQVWEVPVHTPDVLASAHAIQAYLEAYKLTGDTSYLDTAVYWAHTGLPFVYFWNNANMPYMLYASIPVFGATWYTGSWFGVAVQWNGLDYAYALLDLAKYDDSLPWRSIARGLTVSAIYQQETSERYEGLYPDGYNFIDNTPIAWFLPPTGIVRNLFVLMGYPAEPVTVVVRSDEGDIHISAAVPVQEAISSDEALNFSLDYPPGMDGYVMIAGLDRPDVVREIDWYFDQGGLEDWRATNDLAELRIQDGALTTRSTGPDPYMVSIPTRIEASGYSEVSIRMSTSKGNRAQLFWENETEQISEASSVSFQIISDGKFHNYLVSVVGHSKWEGVITRLRLDPTDSSESEIVVESIVGMPESASKTYGRHLMKNQMVIEEADDLSSVIEGWKYDDGTGLLFLKLDPDSANTRITIPKPRFTYVPQVSPRPESDGSSIRGGLTDWAAAPYINNLGQIYIQEGVLFTTSIGSDPHIISPPTEINATDYTYLLIRMRTSKGGSAQFFWSTETEPISEATSVSFQIISDGEFHDYFVPVGQNMRWKGTITYLRFDPTDSPGSEVAIEGIVGYGGAIPVELPDGTAIDYPPWDINRDGRTDVLDIILIGQHFGQDVTTPLEPNPDVNRDGTVDMRDLILAGKHFGEVYLPVAPPKDPWDIDPQHVNVLVSLYNIMKDNPSSHPDFLATKNLLHKFISGIRIRGSELFQNYPNPFNPETWIPFQLSEDSEVTIRIYSINGQLIKVLDSGRKRAGLYLTRDTATYWDGANDTGESVASGLYFYNIRVGDFSATRKMVVKK